MNAAGFDIETELFDAKNNKHIRNVKFVCGAVVNYVEKKYFTDIGKMWAELNLYNILYAHNASFDLGVLNRAGFYLGQSTHVYDTKTMAWLLDENNKTSLDIVAERYLGEKKTETIAKGFVPRADCEKTKEYVLQDAALTFKLGLRFRQLIETRGSADLLSNIEMPFRFLMDKATEEGALLNVGLLKEKQEEVSKRVQEIKNKFLAEPYKINIASTKQVASCLYYFPERMPKSSKGNIKTDNKTLRTIEPLYLKPEVKEILEYRELSKLLSTYMKGLLNAVHPEDGLVHPLYNTTIAKTGRLSSGGSKSAYPYSFNIQNITKRHKDIRKAFISKPGTKMVVLDANALELRILAHYSEDPQLLYVFQNNIDPHAHTAALIYNKARETVTKKERDMGKTLNFAALYGATPHGLYYNLGIPMKQAGELLDAFYQRYASVASLKHRLEIETEEKDQIRSLYGRYRHNCSNFKEYFSALIQGTAADLMKECAVGASRVLDPSYKLFLQVHDEFGFYVPESKAAQATKEIVEAFEKNHRSFNVPIVFNGSYGDDWVSAKEGEK